MLAGRAAARRAGSARWREARRLAAQRRATEVAVATTADGLVEGPTDGPGSARDGARSHCSRPAATATAWPQLAGADTVHFITDGAVARPLPPGVVVHSVFEAADERGHHRVRCSSVARRLEQAATAYLEVVNFADAGQNVHLTITRGDTAILDRNVQVHAGEALRQMVPLGRGGDRRLRVHVAAPHNALEADDEAFAWIAARGAGRRRRRRPADRLVAAALRGNPDVRATFIDPSKYELPPEPSSSAGTDEDVVDLRSMGAGGPAGQAGDLRRSARRRVADRTVSWCAEGVGRDGRRASALGDGGHAPRRARR